MQRIAHETATDDDLFTDGDPLTEVPPTVLTAAWANAVQEELANAVETLLPLEATSSRQLATVLLTIVDSILLSTLRPVELGDEASLVQLASDPTGMVIVGIELDASTPVRRTNDGGRSWSSPVVGGALGTGPEATLRSIAYGDEQFVAVGDSGTIRTVPESDADWTRQTPDESFTGTFHHVANALGQWFAGGSDGGVGELQRSLDSGATWESLDVPAAQSYGPFASDDSVLVAATDSGILRSTDGLVWTPAALSDALNTASERIAAISRVPNGWLALVVDHADPFGTGWVIATYSSTDSESWQRHDFHFEAMGGYVSIDQRTGAMYGSNGLRLLFALPLMLGTFLEPRVLLSAVAEGDVYMQRVGRRFAATMDNALHLSGLLVFG
jgi:hypothetical protein